MFQRLSARKSNRTATVFAAAALFGLTGLAFTATHVQAQDAPKQDAPKQDAPKQDAPKQDASKPEPTYSVQRTYKAGDSDRYKSTVNQTIDLNGGLTITITMLMKENTTSVTPEGTVTVEEIYEQADADINGMPMDLTSQFPKVIMITDKKGHTEFKTEGGSEQIANQLETVAKQMGNIQTLALPSKPVKVGESWSPDMSKLNTESGAKTTLTVKLEAVEMLHGVKTLKLKSVMDSLGGQDTGAKMHVDTTMEVDAQTGKLIKMTSKSEGNMNGNKFSSDTVMERVEPDAKKDAKPAAGDKAAPTAKPDPAPKKP